MAEPPSSIPLSTVIETEDSGGAGGSPAGPVGGGPAGTSRADGAFVPAPAASGSTATLQLSDCKLVCVEYPGRIISVDKMLATIGGEQGVSKTFGDPSKRLELRYRPQDPYCHPVCGNRYSSSNLLIRVRRRTRRGNPADSHITMEILGLISTTYKFQGMADFQYMAIHSETDGTPTSLYDKIMLVQPEKKEFYDKSVPLFLPPPIFSRLDGSVDYFYRPDVIHKKEGSAPHSASKKNLIGMSRARRPTNAIFVSFDDKEVPSAPLDAARQNWHRLCQHPSDHQAEEQIKELFARRPIWSRNAVKANIDIHPEKLKLLLPCVAYYMLTGPWRSLWVRLGYDPRKTPEAKIYQVLDFRIRCGMKHGYGFNDMPVKAKRSSYSYNLPTTLNKAVPSATSVEDIGCDDPSGPSPATTRYKLKDSVYIFREGMLPPYRQMFYQVCDLEVDRIKAIIHQNDGKEEGCGERDGWCVPRTSDELRNIISAMITDIVRATRPGLLQPKPRRGTAGRRGLRTHTTAAAEEDEEDEDDEEFQPSEGSDNEMETEMLDYM